MAARNPFEARYAVSRRGGPAKPPLSRDAIVMEALRQLTSDGLGGISLRKVATALEAGPPRSTRTSMTSTSCTPSSSIARWPRSIFVAQHANGLDPADPEGAVARAVVGASARDYPRVHAARAQLLSGTGEERFAWAVDVFLRGILLTPRASQVRPMAARTLKSRARKKSSRGR